MVISLLDMFLTLIVLCYRFKDLWPTHEPNNQRPSIDPTVDLQLHSVPEEKECITGENSETDEKESSINNGACSACELAIKGIESQKKIALLVTRSVSFSNTISTTSAICNNTAIMMPRKSFSTCSCIHV